MHREFHHGLDEISRIVNQDPEIAQQAAQN